MQLAVRWATDDDRPAGRELLMRTWQDAYAHVYTPEEIRAFFDQQLPMRSSYEADRSEHIGTLLAHDGDMLLGLAHLAMRREGDGELVALYVLPEDQDHGVGHALWEASVGALRERGCTVMQIWVLEANGPAIGFYERHGCVAMARGTFAIGDHEEPVLGYRLDL